MCPHKHSLSPGFGHLVHIWVIDPFSLGSEGPLPHFGVHIPTPLSSRFLVQVCLALQRL